MGILHAILCFYKMLSFCVGGLWKYVNVHFIVTTAQLAREVGYSDCDTVSVVEKVVFLQNLSWGSLVFRN